MEKFCQLEIAVSQKKNDLRMEKYVVPLWIIPTLSHNTFISSQKCEYSIKTSNNLMFLVRESHRHALNTKRLMSDGQKCWITC